MSDANKSNLTQTLVVIAVGAAIGFGAVYAITGGGDNPRVDGDAVASSAPAASGYAAKPTLGIDAKGRTTQSVPFDTSARLKDLGKPAAEGSAVTKTSASPLLVGPNGEKLNRGDMTTFVFKKQPVALPKEARFNGPDGAPLTLDNFKGKVVLLNLWATWCAPCRKEMPHLNQLQQELGSDSFEVVAVSIDRGSPDKSKKFLDEVGATALRLYHDPGAQLGFTLKAIGMPATLLINGDGREIGRLVGPAEWHGEDAKRLIRAAVAAGS